MELVGFLLRTILGPILNTVLPPVIQFALDLIMTVMSSIFYTLLKSLLQIVEVIESSFKIFAGIGTVSYNGRATDLLRLFVLENNSITRAFWILTILSFTLCIAFTLYATARSALDFDFENKRPVGKILGSLGKAGVTFLLIPFFAMFAIRLSNVVMVQVYNVTQTESLSVSDTVFQISAMSANKDAGHNLGPSQSFTTGMRANYNNGGWKDVKKVEQNFDLKKFDYILGYGLSIFMIIIFGTIAFTFVQRLFEIMLLYISAPFFVSSMPLDDGQKYSAWRDMFIAKLASSMGTIALVNLFLMSVPLIMDDALRLDSRPEALDPANVFYNYLLKIVFIVGGALAVKQGGSLITGIVNYQAGMQESQTMQQSGAILSGAVAATGAFAGAAALKVGRGAFKAAAVPVKFAGRAAFRGIQYGLTKKMLSEGEKPDIWTKSFRWAYKTGSSIAAGASEVKDTAKRTKAFFKGDFAGAARSHGRDNYEAQRIQAFKEGNMVDFIRMGSADNAHKGHVYDMLATTDRRAAQKAASMPWKEKQETVLHDYYGKKAENSGGAPKAPPAERKATDKSD
jgi:hypothetical protein